MRGDLKGKPELNIVAVVCRGAGKRTKSSVELRDQEMIPTFIGVLFRKIDGPWLIEPPGKPGIALYFQANPPKRTPMPTKFGKLEIRTTSAKRPERVLADPSARAHGRLAPAGPRQHSLPAAPRHTQRPSRWPAEFEQSFTS